MLRIGGFLLIYFFLTFNVANSQTNSPLEQIYTFKFENVTLKNAIKTISKQCKIKIAFKSDDILKKPIINQSFSNEKLSIILSELLKPNQLEFEYLGGNSIIIKPKRIMNKNSNYIFSGYVIDKKSGEHLSQTIIIERVSKQVIISNNEGFFNINLKNDSVFFEIYKLGYKKYNFSKKIKSNTYQLFNIEPLPEIETIIISSEKYKNQILELGLDGYQLNGNTIKSTPSFLGSADLFSIIKILPGIQSVGETSNGLIVRGGGPDQNLVLLDGIPAYQISHFFGLFSTTNSAMIQNVQFQKSGFYSKYSGRVSSVLDLKLKNGNVNKIRGGANIGLLSSGFFLEGPILKKKSSFIISARRTHLDLLYNGISNIQNIRSKNKTVSKGGYYFYDINAKVNLLSTKRNQFSIQFTNGKDKGFFNKSDVLNIQDSLNNWKINNQRETNINWQNTVLGMKWTTIVNSNLFSTTMAGFTSYSTKFSDIINIEEQKNTISNRQENVLISQTQNKDIVLKNETELNIKNNQKIIFGANIIMHQFNTGKLQYVNKINLLQEDTTLEGVYINALDYHVFSEFHFNLNKKINGNLGLGIQNIHTQNIVYPSFQPRANLSLIANANSIFNISFVRIQQYLQIVPNNTTGIPIDIWVPVSANIKPLTSNNACIGYHLYKPNKIDLFVELYYKNFENILELKKGEIFTFGGNAWESQLYQGRGKSYGLEIILKKNIKKWETISSYTLSKSTRIFNELNNGEAFPYKYDRRHIFNLLLKGYLNKKWFLVSNFTWATGNVITVPTSVYIFQNQLYYNFSSVNNLKLPNYHRLDLGLQFTKFTKKIKHQINFGVFNIYNQINPMFVTTSTNDIGQLSFFQVGLIPILPYFNYEFSF